MDPLPDFGVSVSSYTPYGRPNLFLKANAFSGIVPEEVIELCGGCDLRASHIWSSIQSILKSNGLRKYYNRIGQIIWHVARLKIYFKERDRVLERIVQEFRSMQVGLKLTL